VLINLGMETRVGAVEHPWEQVLELPDAASKPLPVDTRITDVFEDVGRLLLILGESGSGKTMTLLELARDLVAVAHQSSDLRQPVPVVFNLSSWTERFTSFTDWLTEELKAKYQIPKRSGRPWLEANRLVLLLDGLDEVQADRRVACIRAINAFLEDQNTTGLVVCSRLAEYAAEPIRLKMNGAICLRPLQHRSRRTCPASARNWMLCVRR
jgi:predicted NACHT family NTPase